MNRSHVVTRLVFSVSLLAALLAVLAWRESRGRLSADAASLGRIEERLGALGEGLDRMVDSLAALSLRFERLAEAPPRDEDASHGAIAAGAEKADPSGMEPMRTLIEKLDEVSRRIERVSATQGGVVVTSAVVETPEDRARIVEENRPIALDPRRPAAERLQALRELRNRDGRFREVALAMMDLIETPDLEPRMRADIIRNLDGVEFPELRAPLLRILASDRHPETRAETVETLQVFYGDPAVHAAVVNVRDNDEDLRVRMEALERITQYEILEERLEKARER